MECSRPRKIVELIGADGEMMTRTSKPLFVFVHGVGATHRIWRYQVSVFEDGVALDLPGHPLGKGCNRISEYAQFVTQTIAGRKLRQVILVGHSMGGAITIEIALAHPQFLAGIVLVGSGARLRVDPVIMKEVKHDYEHAARLMADRAFSPKNDGALREASVRELLKVPADVTYGDFEACGHFDRMHDIDRIDLPTLVVCGENDLLTPVKYSQYLKERIDNARCIVVPDAGHSVMLEKPEALNRVLRSFQEELSEHGRIFHSSL